MTADRLLGAARIFESLSKFSCSTSPACLSSIIRKSVNCPEAPKLYEIKVCHLMSIYLPNPVSCTLHLLLGGPSNDGSAPKK